VNYILLLLQKNYLLFVTLLILVITFIKPTKKGFFKIQPLRRLKGIETENNRSILCTTILGSPLKIFTIFLRGIVLHTAPVVITSTVFQILVLGGMRGPNYYWTYQDSGIAIEDFHNFFAQSCSIYIQVTTHIDLP